MQGTDKNERGNAIIQPGLRADIMRQLMETKDTLEDLGSLYVGTGTTISIPATDGVDYIVRETKELKTGGGSNRGKVLTVQPDGDIGYQNITPDMLRAVPEEEGMFVLKCRVERVDGELVKTFYWAVEQE